MFQKTYIHLHLSDGDIPQVMQGKSVKTGDKIIKRATWEIDEYDLAKVLKIDPEKVEKLVALKEGESVKEGQILATHKTVVNVHTVKSPVSGEFVWIDKKKGRIGIKRKKENDEMIAWFSGEVDSITKEKITFSVIGKVIKVKEGKGSPVSGESMLLSHDVTALTMPIDIADRILVIKKAFSDIIAKADALGASALIAEEIEPVTISLPYVLVDSIEPFGSFVGHTILLSGDEKQLLVIKEPTKK